MPDYMGFVGFMLPGPLIPLGARVVQDPTNLWILILLKVPVLKERKILHGRKQWRAFAMCNRVGNRAGQEKNVRKWPARKDEDDQDEGGWAVLAIHPSSMGWSTLAWGGQK